MTAADSSGNGRNGTLTNVGTGTAAFVATQTQRASNLTSTSATVGGYVKVPASLQTMGATTAVTITVWVYVRTAFAWSARLRLQQQQHHRLHVPVARSRA